MVTGVQKKEHRGAQIASASVQVKFTSSYKPPQIHT